MPDPTVSADFVIEIAKIRSAAEALRDAAVFLNEIDALNEKVPLVELSVNELIAGPDRTLGDLFDFTGEMFAFYIKCNVFNSLITHHCLFYPMHQDWANNLEGTPTYSVSVLTLANICPLHVLVTHAHSLLGYFL